jgi:signal transduction histidine kinase
VHRVRKAIETQIEQIDSKRARHENGDILFEDISIFPLITNGEKGAVIRVDNVTEKVRLEEMMIQSEKMLSVGGLAAGMAHEINNPLAGMMQTANVMNNRLTDKGLLANVKAAENAGIDMEAVHAFMEERGIFRMVDAIKESGERISNIVDNMLSFARKSEHVSSSHDIANILDKTLELASTDYDLKKRYDFKTIRIIKEYAESLPLTPCEEAKIQQVVLNILRNGAESMQGAGVAEPVFTLRTRSNPKHVCIEIEDNGPGMDEKTRKRIFEPFFTTKPVGVGTGLGLSVSYFIITENHGGAMSVESKPSHGAKFTICLPLNGNKGQP